MMSDDAVISDVGAAAVESAAGGAEVVTDAVPMGGAGGGAEVQGSEVQGADGGAEVPESAAGGAEVVQGDDDGGGAEESAAGGDGAEIEIVWPDGAEVSEPLVEVATRAAREAGLTDGAVAGAFVVKALEGINARAAAVEAESEAQLKADWGEDYGVTKKECEGFLRRMRDESGLTDGDLAPLMSAKGFRLVRAMMGYVGERAAAGLVAAPDAGERVWARDAMRNPQHGDYAALHDVSHPRWREVNARYNRAMGMNGF